MALKGFLTESDYSVVDVHQYDHKSRILHFELITYQSSAKNIELSRLSFDASYKADKLITVEDFISDTPPQNPQVGQKFAIRRCDEPPFHNMSNHVVEHTGERHGGWLFTSLYNDDDVSVFVKSTQKFYRPSQDVDGVWNQVEKLNTLTMEQWDMRFSPSSLEEDGANLIKAIYTYLSTKSGFEHTVAI